MIHGIRHNNITYENIIHAGANRIIYFYDYRQNIFNLFDMPVFAKNSGIKTYHVFLNLSHIETFRKTNKDLEYTSAVANFRNLVGFLRVLVLCYNSRVCIHILDEETKSIYNRELSKLVCLYNFKIQGGKHHVFSISAPIHEHNNSEVYRNHKDYYVYIDHDIINGYRIKTYVNDGSLKCIYNIDI